MNLLNTIIGEKIGVLDDGFVRVIDYMGDDSAIVQAARVSYGAGTKKKNKDEQLIRHLMRAGHTSPFEMCEIKLHVRVPMDTWRQWIRHRTANVNEYSTRYSLAISQNQKTEEHAWRLQSSRNKQGSMDQCVNEDKGRQLSKIEGDLHKYARDVYDHRVALGVAREQARKDLPLSTYTEAYWKIDLKNLLNFLRLRLDHAAQYEIRQYAMVIADLVHKWCPMTWRAFCDYQLNSVTFSAIEMQLLADVIVDYPWVNDCVESLEQSRLSKTEQTYFVDKLKGLGINLEKNITTE